MRAPGLDGRTAAEFALLPEGLQKWVAEILRIIEVVGVWLGSAMKSDVPSCPRAAPQTLLTGGRSA